MVPWTMRGVLGGSPGEEVVATLKDWVRKETGEEGGNKNKCGQSSSLICNARYQRRGRIMGNTGVKDEGRARCEKRKILTLPSPYPFLVSDRR